MCLNELQRRSQTSPLRPVCGSHPEDVGRQEYVLPPLLGSALVVVGVILAVLSAAGISQPGQTRDASKVIVGDQNQPDRDEAASMVLPVIAGLSIAAGTTMRRGKAAAPSKGMS
jgi:hypothetical protein